MSHSGHLEKQKVVAKPFRTRMEDVRSLDAPSLLHFSYFSSYTSLISYSPPTLLSIFSFSSSLPMTKLPLQFLLSAKITAYSVHLKLDHCLLNDNNTLFSKVFKGFPEKGVGCVATIRRNAFSFCRLSLRVGLAMGKQK